MPSKATTWSETLEKQFLLDIIDRAGTKVSPAILDDIANKYGKPHTRGSLQKKFERMKKSIAAENADAGGSGDVKTGDKRKAHGDDDDDLDDASGTKKLEAPKAKKGSKIKVEDDSD